jgi:guanosine-3',5'-bis(diphosphate) 3'-pyrophosphohydrolase
MDPPPRLVVEAIRFAAQKHAGQVRKDGITPYVSHPYRVLFHLLHAGVTDPETLAAAALHDTIEDTTADYDDLEERFGKNVAGYVALLTKDKRKQEEEREDEYFAQLAKAPLAVKLSKLADTYDNLIDAVHLRPEQAAKAIGKAERLLGLFRGQIPERFAPLVRWIEGAMGSLGRPPARKKRPAPENR